MKKVFFILIIILLILIVIGIVYKANNNNFNFLSFFETSGSSGTTSTTATGTSGTVTSGTTSATTTGSSGTTSATASSPGFSFSPSPKGTAPSSTPSSGTAPSGTTPSGTASSGTASSGTASSGTTPSGTASSGTASSGTTPSSTPSNKVFECPSNNGGIAPNCAKNYINTPINIVPAQNCCLPDPNGGNPDEVTRRLDIAKTIVTEVAISIGFDAIATFVAYKVIGVSEKVATDIFIKSTSKFMASVGEKLGLNSAKSMFININRAGIQVTEKLGLGVGEKIVKTGAVAAKTGVAAGRTWAQFGMNMVGGPVGLALLAVQILSMGLDLANVGNYNDITYLDVWRQLKNKINTTIGNKITENGGKIPESLIMSPINNFPSGIDVSGNPLPETIDYIEKFKASTSDKTIVLREPANKYEITRVISIEYIINYITLMLKNMDTSNLTEIDFENIKTRLIKEATDYLISDKGSDYIYQKLCNHFPNSKMIEINGEKYCTYKDKQSCDASYDWAKLKQCLATDNKDCNQTYVQWVTDASNNSYCKYTSFIMKSTCEDKGLPYDYDKEICRITPEYCQGKAVDYTTESDGLGNCKIGVGQQLAEIIFGTTITRGLIQVFDPGQYESCPEGWYDGANLPQELKIAMGLGVMLPPPLNTIPILYETMGNKMCVSKYRCLDGLENDGGLCYPPCKSGFKSDGATQCYKQYPGTNGSLIDIYMGSETKAPTPMDTCPPGQNKAAPGGLICYRDCRPGYHPNATGETCVQDCPPGYDLNGTLTCGLKVHSVIGSPAQLSGGGCNTYIDHGDRDMYGNGKLKTDCTPITSKCPSGQQELLGFCYNCPSGTSPQSPGFCSQGGPLTIQTNTYPREIGDAIGCSPNKQKVNGMCYDKCSPGYSMGPGSQGICWQQCPAGSKPTNLVDNSASATCLRESYNRGGGIAPFEVKFKNRKIAFSK